MRASRSRKTARGTSTGWPHAGYGLGRPVEETRPGFFSSAARLKNGSAPIGLQGVQAWYRL